MKVMNDLKYYESSSALPLENGGALSQYRIAYQTWGQLNKDKSNVIWIVHALTANTDPTDWWPNVVGPGYVIDPAKHFIVCANMLGSHYGSTNALDINPDTGVKYYHDFPLLTNRDIAAGYEALRHHLDLPSIHLLVGASLGGQQALEWSIAQHTVISKLILIATNAQHSPYGIAWNESQRLAIQADHTWKERRDDAGHAGLLAARSMALLSYRTAQGYDLTQTDDRPILEGYRATTYQHYQGAKLVKRFDAFSYWTLSKSMDSHNVGRNRGGVEKALSTVHAKTTIIGIDSDFLFPTREQKLLSNHIPDARYVEISSALGHDGFLTEHGQVSNIIQDALDGDHTSLPIIKAS